MSEVFATGAVFRLVDEFDGPLRRLIGGLESAENKAIGLQAKLDKLGLGTVVTKMESQWEEISRISSAGVDKILKTMGRIGLESGAIFGEMTKGAKASFEEVSISASGLSGEVVEAMKGLKTGAVAELQGIGAAAPELFQPIATAATAAADAAIGSLGRINDAIKASAAEMRGLSTEAATVAARSSGGGAAAAGVVPVSGVGQAVATSGGASLRTRTMAAHDQNNAAHGGFHFRPHGMAIPGAHLGMSQGGDGMAPLVGGLVIGELLKKGIEAGFDFEHWASGMKGAGFSDAQVGEAKQAAWANAGANPNASATDSLKNILELNKATGDLAESMKLLPVFSTAEMGMQSVKAEGLHSKFNGGTQILNLARGLEELGVTQRGKTPEEREANVKHYTQELMRTMIASRGLFDGNALFAMTNNSGGAAQNFDERMATVVAPIIGDIMKASKLGNADYMLNRSYAQGIVTPKAVGALQQYGLTEPGDVSPDGKHLKANSKFAAGLPENAWEWSKGILAKLQAQGIDTSNQKAMNEVVNAIGSNKSTTMFMRALLEPGTRMQIQKEMDLRDKVPTDAAGILQNTDPVLKMDALHKKWQDLLTALGGPLVDPAIAVLTKLTSGINAFAQAMEAHPDLTKVGAMGAGVAALGLTGYGAARMLGFGGGGAALSGAATALDASALALKEAAAALSGRALPGVGAGPGGTSPGYTNLIPAAALTMFQLYELGKDMPDVLKKAETDNAPVDPALKREGAMGDAIRHYWKDYNPFDMGAHAAEGATIPGLNPSGVAGQASTAIAGRLGLPAGIDMSGSIERATAGLGLLQKQEELNVWQFGQLTTSTGIVKASFDGLNGGSSALNDNFAGLGTGSAGLRSALDILTQTAMGAARAMASVALSGGGGGGLGGGGIGGSGGSGGFTNASWGGGTLPVGSGFGGGSWSQSGATKPEVADYIRQQAAKNGIDPNVALRVSQSEGFNSYTGDYGTSFGPFQLHYGGSGIRGMNSGGIGDRFTKATGLNARDPKTWRAQVDYALGVAKHEGWGQWHGAAHVGIGNRQGLDYHGAVPTVSAGRPAATVSAPPPRKVSPGAPAGSNMTTAMNRAVPVHTHLHLDGRELASSVSHHMVAGMEHPNAVGGPDTYGSWQGPATPLNDAA